MAAKSQDTLDKAFDKFKKFTEGNDPITIHICDLERRALLKLFRRNAKKLDQNKEEEPIMDALYKSFVLPLCPLNMLTLGKLTLNTGCEVCGKKDTSRCVQCLAVAYCSRGKLQLCFLWQRFTWRRLPETRLANTQSQLPLTQRWFMEHYKT